MAQKLIFTIITGLTLLFLAACDECTRSSDCGPGEVCRDGDCTSMQSQFPFDGGIMDLDIDGDTDTDTDTDTDADEDSGPTIEIPEDCKGEGVSWDYRSELCWADEVISKPMTQRGAIEYCSSLNHAGFDDWELPLIQELRTLIMGCPTVNCGLTDPDCLDLSCAGSDCTGCPGGQGLGDKGCYFSRIINATCPEILWSASGPGTNNVGYIVLLMSGAIIENTATVGWPALCVRPVPAD